MATQQDATEQVKEVLRQIIKYRFWISISIAALLATGAYFVGRGPVAEATKKETGLILAAKKDVEQYTANSVPTPSYEPIIREKTEVVSKDVNSAWKSLYERQAPLLTWPDPVQERFRKWGRAWPENEDATRVMIAIGDYIEAYPTYVEMVYKTFHPFNYETGEGIVAAPSKEALLRPAIFSAEANQLPDLGKVWASQERLWVQRTVLEVVAQVNKNAKNWDGAIVRQIDGLEVANPIAQDQRSLAKGETLTASAAITAPGQEAAAEADAEAGTGAMGAMSRGRRGMMDGMGGMGGSAQPTGAGSQYDESVYYIPPPNDKNQYKILPIMMSVLIDQDRVQDFLIELENSPMSIQVMDIDLQRPSSRVVKPEKGVQNTSFGMMGRGMGMGMMGRESAMAMGGMGGRAGMTGFGGMMGREGGMGMMGRQGGMGMPGMGGAATAARKGVDIRSKNMAKARDEKEKAIENAKLPSTFDPYYDIVQLTIYGQARFFSAPPVEEAPPETKPEEGAEPAPVAAAPAAATPAEPAAADATKPAAESADPAEPAAADAAKPAPAPADATKPAAAPAPTPPAAAAPAPAPEKPAPAKKS